MKLKSSDIPRAAEARLHSVLTELLPYALTRVNTQEVTAHVLCGLPWKALPAHYLSTDEPSQRDEDCGAVTFAERRRCQAERLVSVMRRYNVAIDESAANQVLRRWQPSARRPMVAADRLYEVRANGGYTGTERHCFQLLGLLELFPRTPSDDEVEVILDNLYFCHSTWADRIYLTAGIVATNLVNQRSGEAAVIGVRMLEAFEGSGFTYARISLAKALLYGWGCSQDPNRAWSLLVSTKDETFTSREGEVEYCRLVAELATREGRTKPDRKLGLEMSVRAAKLGDCESALHVCMFYAPEHRKAPDSIYADVVAPDQALFDHYFALAVRNGYEPKAGKFAWEG